MFYRQHCHPNAASLSQLVSFGGVDEGACLVLMASYPPCEHVSPHAPSLYSELSRWSWWRTLLDVISLLSLCGAVGYVGDWQTGTVVFGWRT